MSKNVASVDKQIKKDVSDMSDGVNRETYGRIGLLRSYGNLQSYWTTTKLLKLTVVYDYYEAMETYSRIVHRPYDRPEVIR